ncbi:MAG: glycosyltransferase [Candidatus Aminicenantes bacterium]|nr:glycosyltransferase [Candidatus Aminicenantes bacterium]
MNILLVAYYFPPLNNAGAMRPLQMAQWLRRCGHTVSILTHGYEEMADTSPEIIRVHDPAFVRAHQGKKLICWLFWRAWAELQNYCGHYASIFSPWRRAVLRRAEEIRQACLPDLILVTYPPQEVLEIGLELSRRFHVPLISDFRDGLLFHPIEEKRLHSHHCVNERYKETEAAVVASSQLVVAVTPVLQDYFSRVYPGCRCETVYNGYDEDEWHDLPKPSLAQGCFHIVHTGRFALSDSATTIDPFLAALRQAGRNNPNRPFRLHLIGEYSRREMSLLENLILTGVVVIHPLKDRRETLAYQKAADLLLLITRPGVRSGIPLKLFEYLYSGKPVLALTDDAHVRRIVEDCGCGWCVPPLDELAIACLMERILFDPIFYRSPQRNQENIGAYSWPRQMTRFNDMLDSLAKPAAKPQTDSPRHVCPFPGDDA